MFLYKFLLGEDWYAWRNGRSSLVTSLMTKRVVHVHVPIVPASAHCCAAPHALWKIVSTLTFGLDCGFLTARLSQHPNLFRRVPCWLTKALRLHDHVLQRSITVCLQASDTEGARHRTST